MARFSQKCTTVSDNLLNGKDYLELRKYNLESWYNEPLFVCNKDSSIMNNIFQPTPVIIVFEIIYHVVKVALDCLNWPDMQFWLIIF